MAAVRVAPTPSGGGSADTAANIAGTHGVGRGGRETHVSEMKQGPHDGIVGDSDAAAARFPSPKMGRDAWPDSSRGGGSRAAAQFLSSFSPSPHYAPRASGVSGRDFTGTMVHSTKGHAGPTLYGRDAAFSSCPRTTLFFCGMIHPKRGFRRSWDVIVLTCLVYLLLSLPYQVAFVEDSHSSWMYPLDKLVDLCFLTDIFVNFRTGFYDEASVEASKVAIMRPNLVAQHYLRSWFTIDFVAAVPLDEIAWLAADDGADVHGALSLRLVKAIRLVRLTKLVRAVKVSDLSDWLEESRLHVNRNTFLVAKLLITIVVVAHGTACSFYFLTTLEDLGNPPLWLVKYDAQSDEPPRHYLSALYFAFTVMTTVGFGDITPKSDLERAMAIVAMIVAAGTYGFIIASLSGLVSEMSMANNMFLSKLNELNSYMHSRKLPEHLRHRLRKYYKYYLKRTTVHNEGAILNALSTSLRNELGQFIRHAVVSLDFFLDKDPEFVKQVVDVLHPMFFEEHDVLFRMGDYGNEMMFISEGAAEVLLDLAPQPMPVAVLEKGTLVGEMAIVCASQKHRRMATVRALTHLEVHALSRDDFDRLMPEFPEVHRAIREIGTQRRATLRNLTQSKIMSVLEGTVTPRAAATPAGHRLLVSLNKSNLDLMRDGAAKVGHAASFVTGAQTSAADRKRREVGASVLAQHALDRGRASRASKRSMLEGSSDEENASRPAGGYRNYFPRPHNRSGPLARYTSADANDYAWGGPVERARRESELSARRDSISAGRREWGGSPAVGYRGEVLEEWLGGAEAAARAIGHMMGVAGAGNPTPKPVSAALAPASAAPSTASGPASSASESTADANGGVAGTLTASTSPPHRRTLPPITSSARPLPDAEDREPLAPKLRPAAGSEAAPADAKAKPHVSLKAVLAAMRALKGAHEALGDVIYAFERDVERIDPDAARRRRSSPVAAAAVQATGDVDEPVRPYSPTRDAIGKLGVSRGVEGGGTEHLGLSSRRSLLPALGSDADALEEAAEATAPSAPVAATAGRERSDADAVVSADADGAAAAAGH